MAVVGPFFDTTVLLAGLIDMGDASSAAQAAMTAVAERQVRGPVTAWHCCLEFYSVATRLPAELRLDSADAVRLLREEVLARFEVLDLPARDRETFLRDAALDGVAGGRVYDLHVAEVARAAGVKVVVTDNRRYFASLLRYDVDRSQGLPSGNE